MLVVRLLLNLDVNESDILQKAAADALRENIEQLEANNGLPAKGEQR